MISIIAWTIRDRQQWSNVEKGDEGINKHWVNKYSRGLNPFTQNSVRIHNKTTINITYKIAKWKELFSQFPPFFFFFFSFFGFRISSTDSKVLINLCSITTASHHIVRTTLISLNNLRRDLVN